MHIWLRNKINTVASAPTAPTGPVFMRIFRFFKGRTDLCFKVSLETLQNAANKLAEIRIGFSTIKVN